MKHINLHIKARVDSHGTSIRLMDGSEVLEEWVCHAQLTKSEVDSAIMDLVRELNDTGEFECWIHAPNIKSIFNEVDKIEKADALYRAMYPKKLF